MISLMSTPLSSLKHQHDTAVIKNLTSFVHFLFIVSARTGNTRHLLHCVNILWRMGQWMFWKWNLLVSQFFLTDSHNSRETALYRTKTALQVYLPGISDCCTSTCFCVPLWDTRPNTSLRSIWVISWNHQQWKFHSSNSSTVLVAEWWSKVSPCHAPTKLLPLMLLGLQLLCFLLTHNEKVPFSAPQSALSWFFDVLALWYLCRNIVIGTM